jgi:ABC-type multidrug transport system fused ATPase/permease subunit
LARHDPHITRRLLGYVQPYRTQILIALVWMTVAMAAYIAGPFLIKVALDSGIAAKNPDVLAQVVLLYMGAACVQWIGTYLRVRIMAVVGQSIIFDMRRQLFDHLQTLSLGFFSRYAVGRLISRVINDVGVLREMITWAVLAVFRDLFDLVGTSFAMVLLNWQLTLLSFLVLPLMGVARQFSDGAHGRAIAGCGLRLVGERRAE